MCEYIYIYMYICIYIGIYTHIYASCSVLQWIAVRCSVLQCRLKTQRVAVQVANTPVVDPYSHRYLWHHTYRARAVAKTHSRPLKNQATLRCETRALEYRARRLWSYVYTSTYVHTCTSYLYVIYTHVYSTYVCPIYTSCNEYCQTGALEYRARRLWSYVYISIDVHMYSWYICIIHTHVYSIYVCHIYTSCIGYCQTRALECRERRLWSHVYISRYVHTQTSYMYVMHMHVMHYMLWNQSAGI